MRASVIEGLKSYIQTELGLSQETFSAYVRDTEEFLDFIGTQELTAQLIENFSQSLEKRGLKSTTIRRKNMSIRCLCHYLIGIGVLDPNILKMIDPIRIHKEQLNVLEHEDMDALLANLEKRLQSPRTANVRRDIAILLILCHSGLRVSELCGLDLGDINFARREIRVLGKGSRERVVPTTHECIEAVRAYLSIDRKSESKAMFVKIDGQRITRRAISDMLISLSRKAKVDHTTAHTLRRSCATALMNKGVDIELIQYMLGHKDLFTTQYYLVVDDKKLKRTHELHHPFGRLNNEAIS